MVYGRVWVVLDVKDSSKERCKTEEFIRVWQTGTARSRKPKETDVNIVDSKNVSSKEWFCKVCFSSSLPFLSSLLLDYSNTPIHLLLYYLFINYSTKRFKEAKIPTSMI